MNTDAALRAQTDPFTVCNKAITDALVAWAPLAAVVRGLNRISTVPREGFLDAERAVTLGKVATSFPGFMVSQSGFLLQPHGRNSRTVDAVQNYTIQWATDVLNVVPLNVVKWLTLQALVNADGTFGLDFVRTYTVRDAQEGTGVVIEPPANTASPGTLGWVAALVVSVEMYWPKSTVLA